MTPPAPTVPTHGDPLGFLAGGGKMGHLIRSMDWSGTPLGPVDSWPQSLRTTVSLCLASDFPINIIWGPSRVQIYNDGYSTLCGGKHPRSMGQEFRECWESAWPTVGEPFTTALTGRAAFLENQRMFLDRNGYLEETFFTFSFSPIRDQTGNIAGLFHPVTETTGNMLSERRMRALRDVAARTSKAQTVEDALALAIQTLADYDLDLPFVLFYALDASGHQARLVASTGIKAGTASSLERVDVSAGGRSVWPLEEAIRSKSATLVDNVGPRLGPPPCGPYPEPPNAALVLPITPPGGDRASVVVIAGVSPRLPLNEAYRSFYDLLASALTTAIANARAHEEEKSRAEALAALDRAKTAFFANVSHEFRTPLTLILGPLAEALASPPHALVGEPLKMVQHNALRLLKLVNTLLDFSRIEAGRAQASYEPTDLATLTADLASVFRSAIERAGLGLDVDCPTLPEPVFVDHDMWEKIVLNLLSNALKFTFKGAIGVRIRWCGDHAELEVRDTGGGISEAELPRIFERFHRVQGARARTHEGSGIGLALVHELVRLHGGRIRAASTRGTGTTFTIAIPRGSAHLPPEHVNASKTLASTATGAAPYVQEALQWLPDADEPGARVPPAACLELGRDVLLPHAGARILLADDNADMRVYVQRILREHWTVDVVGDGTTALEAARRAPPSLVLTDVMMPGLDGFGLLRELRAQEATRNVPVILLSARAGEESRIEGLRAGADDYLVKPFSSRELVARVANQLQLAELRRAAEHERAKMYALFMQAPVAIAVWQGPEHVYTLANPHYERMFGKRALVGRTFREAFSELKGQAVFEMLDAVYATGAAVAYREFRLSFDRRNDGTLEDGFFAFSLEAMRESDRRITGLMAVVIEVTEQVLARRRLEDAAREREELLNHTEQVRREAERANRVKDEFLAMLGHELRNPLAPIATALALMRLRHGNIAERERSVIERQVSHLTRLVEDLLDVSRVTSGKVELKKQRLELAEIVAKAVELASPLLEQRRHHLALAVPSRGLAIDADPTRLAQVISNLLTNAAKYTGIGGQIAVEAAREGAAVVLHVRDNGTGIAPDMLPRVFDLFLQERQTLDRAQGGLGLGLAIVRSLVTLHNGTVSAHSEGRGRGSTFTIRLPAAPSTTGEALLPESASAKRAPTSDTVTGCRVLVVDDNRDAAELLAETLSALGHVTCIAYDGPAALRLAKAFLPDVALLDIGLPAMDGYELGQRLRELPGLADIRLIAVTGYGQSGDRRRSASAGFDAHLLKPVQVEELMAQLKLSPPRSSALSSGPWLLPCKNHR